ncbi:MAG TPA: SRPBCC domain-containing protein [Caulobacteraceae bacterium]|nr:SRPBCC domain-containing protein [Caulobacteraceae bacterium]
MGEKLEHRIGVQAPADLIWESLIDVPGWPRWNPLYPKADGVVRIGNVLDLTLQLPGRPAQQIKPVILDWVPNELIHWKLKLMGGLVKTTRYIEIEALSETGCIFSNGEMFDGWLASSVVKQHGRAIRAGFASMGEALRARAEATWRERQGITT